jgi:hypothetical protein
VLEQVLPLSATTEACSICVAAHPFIHYLAGVDDFLPIDLLRRWPAAAGILAAVIVGIDDGYVRNWHAKKLSFEVVVGKSMAMGRDDRYFGLLQNQYEQLKRRLREVLRTQGLPVNQTVTMLTDGGDSVVGLVGEISSGAAHYLDWFHIALRLTGLGQYAKGLAHHNPIEALALHWLKRLVTAAAGWPPTPPTTPPRSGFL